MQSKEKILPMFFEILAELQMNLFDSDLTKLSSCTPLYPLPK